jgi:streptogramin lyase
MMFRSTIVRGTTVLASSAALAFLSACGGGGGSTGSFVPSGSASAGPVAGAADATSFVIVVPPASPSSSRRPAFVSPNTGSISIVLQSVNGTANSAGKPTVATIGASSSECASSTAGLKCTVTVNAPPGDDVFSIATYQSSNATGAVLASTTVAAVVGASATSVTLSLGGVPASLTFSPARLPLVANGAIQRVPVVVNAADASGATIVGSTPYQSPVGLQIQNDPAHALTLSTPSVSQPGTVVTVTYNSSVPLANASIVASDNGLAPATLVAAPLVVNPVPPVMMFDDTASTAVTLTEAGFTGAFAVSVANAADASVALAPGTLGSGTAVANVTPKVHFDVTSLNVSDGTITAAVPLQIVPQNSAYSPFAPQHEIVTGFNMVEGPGGLLWAGDALSGNLVCFNPSTGAYTTFNVDPFDEGPQGIAFDAKGNIWYGDGQMIGEFTPSTRAVNTFTTGLEPSANVSSIIAGPNGSMWFYDSATTAPGVSGQPTFFGSISTTTGAITEFQSANGAGPLRGAMSMVLAKDGSIWFTDQFNFSLGHLNTSTGAITEIGVSQPAFPQESPMQLTVAPDGKIWFLALSSTAGTSIAGSVDPANNNAIALGPTIPGNNLFLGALFDSFTTGSNGDLWFVEDPGTFLNTENQSNLGIINPTTGAVFVYPTALMNNSVIDSIVDRGDGTLWMLDTAFGQIGKVTFK